MLKALKQRPSLVAINLKKKDDAPSDHSSSLSQPSLILKKASNFTPQLLNYASIVMTVFAQSLIPFAIYKSSGSTSSESAMLTLSYQCSSAVAAAEIVKLIIAILIVWIEFDYNVAKTMETMLFDVFQVHTFAVSGILYAISMVTYIKMMSEFGLLYSYYSLLFKIAWTTLIWKIIFHQKQITTKQWLSIALIIVSVICLTFEYADSWSYFPFLGRPLSNSVISATPSDPNPSDIELYNYKLDAIVDVADFELHEHGRSRSLMNSNSNSNSNSNMFGDYWFVFLFIESVFASIASVTAEHKYKTFEKNLSYFAQSSSMYLWSLVIASVLFYIANIKQASKELLVLNLTYALNGFNRWTWCLVFVFVLNGYSFNYVVKYFNNIVLLLVLSVACCFSHILVYWITNDSEFIASIGPFCVIAYGCVAVSVYLYKHKI